MFEKSVLSKLALPILMILLLNIAGCGSKAKTPEQIPIPAPAAVVTYENYLKIQIDSSYEDVKKILGEEKTKDIKAEIVEYTWDEQGKTIQVETNKGIVQTKIQSKLGKTSSDLTVDQFDKIKNGMTIDQLVSILGPDYQEVSLRKSANAIQRNVAWRLPDSTFIKVYLNDGKVIKKNNALKK